MSNDAEVFCVGMHKHIIELLSVAVELKAIAKFWQNHILKMPYIWDSKFVQTITTIS